jgi:hypothetical protein
MMLAGTHAMRQKGLLGTVLIALIAGGVCNADQCAPAYPPSGLVAGHDDQGYFVRAAPTGGQEKVPRDAPIDPLADYLASQAGTIVVYVDGGTGRDLAGGEWRGDDPLSVLQAFAAAAGTEVVVPTPGFWVVGRPAMLDGSGVTLFIQALDPAAPAGWSADDLHELEFALFQQLPVRGRGAARGMHYQGLAYHWVGGSEPDTLLLVSSERMGGMLPKYTFFRAFKVRVSRLGGRIQVSCLWSSDQIAGTLVEDIQQDFDGDGLTDFVFDRYEDVEGSPVILSGKDGHLLLRFEGAEIATERTSKGPLRISAFEPTEADATAWEAQVLRFDPDAGHFVRASQQESTAATSSTELPPQPRRGLAGLLAEEVGGKDNVAVWRVLRERPSQVVQVTPREMRAGFAGKVLLEYKSPGYLEEERREAAVKHE